MRGRSGGPGSARPWSLSRSPRPWRCPTRRYESTGWPSTRPNGCGGRVDHEEDYEITLLRTVPRSNKEVAAVESARLAEETVTGHRDPTLRPGAPGRSGPATRDASRSLMPGSTTVLPHRTR